MNTSIVHHKTIQKKTQPKAVAKPKTKTYYTIFKGKTPGIYPSWSECQKNLGPRTECEYEMFCLESEAKEYLETGEVKLELFSVYVDGSFDPGSNIATCGGFFGKNHEKNFQSDVPGVQSSPRAELWAIFKALETCADWSRLCIMTDCDYARRAALQEVNTTENLDLLEQIWQEIKRPNRVVEIRRVPGHAKFYGNEKAHQLAYDYMTLLRKKNSLE